MADSNDTKDEKNANIPAEDMEGELDARLLEAAQRWAEEFNPNLGTEDQDGEFTLNGQDQDRESRKKSKPKKSKGKMSDEAQTPSDYFEAGPVTDFETTIGFDVAEQIAAEEELQTEALQEVGAILAEVDLENVLAHFDAKAEREAQLNGCEPESEKEAEEPLELEVVAPHEANLSPKKPRKPKKDKELALAPETSLEAEIVTDDKQGLMRWDEAINLEAQVEAILFAAPKPISVSEVAECLADEDGNEPNHSTIDSIIQQLQRLYKERNGGFRLEYDRGSGFQFRTVPAAAPIMERMFSSRQRPLSRAAHETLAIIAYRQPCTRADIEFIRGVDAGSIIKNLLERDLVACVGRKEDSGRPMLFGTTTEFMRVFRIQSLNDLPPLSAFQPASEAIIDAFQKIDRPDHDIDVEDFIGDDSRQQPSISGPLSADFAKSDGSFEVREDGSESSASTQAKVRRSGGIFDNEGFLSDGHENTEVALPTRDSITERSGEDASRGSDQHQRKSGARTGDEDPT